MSAWDWRERNVTQGTMHATCGTISGYVNALIKGLCHLIRRVIHYKVHHQFHTSFLEFGNQVVDIFVSPINGIYGLVVCYVISHVFLRTLIYCMHINMAFSHLVADEANLVRPIQYPHLILSDSPALM